MSNRNGTAARKRPKRSELRATAISAREPRAIPLVWLCSVIAFFLLAPAWISTLTFFTCFRHAAMDHRFWASEEFWFFGLGAVLWVIAFIGLPRPLLIYVFGHELTHALWVWIMGGRVSDFRVSRTGGHIVSDKHNFFIALAPYFFPLYSIAVIAAYGAGELFANMEPYHRWLYALIGVTWDHLPDESGGTDGSAHHGLAARDVARFRARVAAQCPWVRAMGAPPRAPGQGGAGGPVKEGSARSNRKIFTIKPDIPRRLG
jgi:hypothetical protein